MDMGMVLLYPAHTLPIAILVLLISNNILKHAITPPKFVDLLQVNWCTAENTYLSYGIDRSDILYILVIA